ncbi:MAG: anti-sigma factor family protein [Bacillota bacterium]
MGQLTCHVVKDLMVAYLDGEISPETSQEINYHLKDCEHCRKLVNQLRLSPQVLGQMEQPGQGGAEEKMVLHQVRQRLLFLVVGGALLLSSAVGLIGFGLFKFFTDLGIPWFIKLGIGGGLLGLFVILAGLILERIKEQRSERDDLGKY